MPGGRLIPFSPIPGLSPEASGGRITPAYIGTALLFVGLDLKCVTVPWAEGFSMCALASPGDGEACAGVTVLGFNHFLRISALRESPHSCPPSGEAGWEIHCSGVTLFQQYSSGFKNGGNCLECTEERAINANTAVALLTCFSSRLFSVRTRWRWVRSAGWALRGTSHSPCL